MKPGSPEQASKSGDQILNKATLALNNDALLSMAISNLIKQHLVKQAEELSPIGLRESPMSSQVIRTEVSTFYGKCWVTVDLRDPALACLGSPEHPSHQNQHIFQQPSPRSAFLPQPMHSEPIPPPGKNSPSPSKQQQFSNLVQDLKLITKQATSITKAHSPESSVASSDSGRVLESEISNIISTEPQMKTNVLKYS